MSLEIKVPMLPESVNEAVVAVWYKSPGDLCEEGEVIVDLETDKVMLEVVATQAGQLTRQHVSEGDTVTANSVLASIDPAGASATPNATVSPQLEPQVSKETVSPSTNSADFVNAAPSLRRVIHDKGIDLTGMAPSARGGRFISEDLVTKPGESFNRVKMSRLRAKIAERLVDAQQTAAILTTFNEVNMAPVMALRSEHQEVFSSKYGVKLGFMSFFVHAVTEALKEFPEVNASVDGQDVLYHHDMNIGIAVSTERGLVVPVLKQAQNMGYADIESGIKAYAKKARDGKISLDDMASGTFTITNGGVFGSLLSTPILNMPQSAILGMHTIQKRPVVENDQIVIRPMMYLALSYDHRLVDGQQSVGFLVRVKEIIEKPALSILGL